MLEQPKKRQNLLKLFIDGIPLKVRKPRKKTPSPSDGTTEPAPQAKSAPSVEPATPKPEEAAPEKKEHRRRDCLM